MDRIVPINQKEAAQRRLEELLEAERHRLTFTPSKRAEQREAISRAACYDGDGHITYMLMPRGYKNE